MIQIVKDPACQASENCAICGEICWKGCLCPECDECGVAGDPDCIVNHMPVWKWEKSLFNLASIIRKNPSVYDELHPIVKIFMDSQVLSSNGNN